MRISRTVPVARGLAVLGAGLAVAGVSAQTIEPVQAQTIEPVHAQTIEPYHAETIDPVTAEVVKPFTADPVEPNATLETDGDFQFEPPAGWKRVAKERLLLFGPPQLKHGTFAALILLPSEAVPGDPVAWLNGWLRTMGQGETELARGTLHDGRTPDGGRQLAIIVQTRTADGTVHCRLYRALLVNGRGYLFLFDAGSLALMQQYLDVVTRFAAHLRVPGAVAPAGTRIGDLRVSIPAGWRREDGSGGSTLVLGGLPEGQTVKLMVFAPQPLPDGFNAWFLDLVDADLRGRTVVQRGTVELGRTGGLETLQALVVGRGDDGGVAWDLLRGYRLGDRGQFLIYRASSQALYDRYLPVARALLDQVVRWDAPAPAPPPQPEPAIPQGFDERLVGTWLAYIPGTFTPNPNGPGGKVGFGGPLGVLRIDAKGHYAWYKQGNRVLQGELTPYNPPDRRRGDVHRYYSISDGTWEMYVTYSEDDGLLSFANQRGGPYAMSAKRSN